MEADKDRDTRERGGHSVRERERQKGSQSERLTGSHSV